MSLRWKIALVMAAMVAFTAATFGAASYRSTQQRLLDEVDRSLIAFDGAFEGLRPQIPSFSDRGPLTGFDAQVLDADGVVRQSTFRSEPPVTAVGLSVVGRRAAVVETVVTAGGEYRLRTIGFRGGAVQIGRSLAETDNVLRSIRARTILIAALITALAGGVGLWIAGRVTASLRRLTDAAERVEATGRLDADASAPVAGHGSDEVGRLGSAFDRMLAALARSHAEQQRLVQNAGHELRTPLTSVRTNLATLRRFPDMPLSDRDAIIDDLDAETHELASLVDEIVATASGDLTDEPVERFDLAEVAAEVAERFERRTGRIISVVATPSPVDAQRASVHRAVSCLVDNAAKFDPSGSPIEITVGDGEVRVLDHGPGIGPGELDRVFERFHRSEGARALPGSGLGLSIVRDVAQRHGGAADAANRPGGGASIGFRLRS
ncbi:MAG: HAMP domain-containing sensor histidine kinase [Ilumatobacteraceae bacterium]